MSLIFLCFLLFQRLAESRSSFRFGAVLSTVGANRAMIEAKRGYEFYVDTVNSKNEARGFLVQGRENTTGYFFSYDFLFREDKSDPRLHARQLELLVEKDAVDFLGGSHMDYALDEMRFANREGLLNYHCCVESDGFYEMDLPTVFGIPVSPRRFPKNFVNALFLVFDAKAAFLYDESDTIMKSMCEGALEYFEEARNPLGKAEIAFNVAFNRSDLDAQTLKEMATRIKAEGVEAAVACLQEEEAKMFVDALHDERFSLKYMFLSKGPNNQEWVDSFDPAFRSNDIFSGALWHPKLLYRDADFGKTVHYSSMFKERYGSIPQTNAAAASAVVMTLTQAIIEAFSNCDISKTGGDVDALLYDAQAIDCDDGAIKGYDRVVDALAKLEMQNFFGRVKFDYYRRNVGLQPVMTQVLQKTAADGSIYRETEAVMPLTYASDLPNYPAENHYREDCQPGYSVGLDTFDPCVACQEGQVSYKVNSQHCESCPIGEWMDQTAQSECNKCPIGTYTEVRGATSLKDCRCMPGYFNTARKLGVACEICPVGATCAGGTEMPVPLPGYWANATNRIEVFHCDPPSVCKGGVDVSCAKGYEGRLCSGCSDGYFNMLQRCHKCLHPLIIVALLVTLISGWYFINVTVSKSVCSLGMILGWAQLANIIGDVNLNWTETVRTMFGVANVLDFDVDILEPSCLISWGYKQNFITQLLLPFVMSLMAFVGYLGSTAAYYMLRNNWIRSDGKRSGLLSLFVVVVQNEAQLQQKWDTTIATFLSSVDVTYVTIAKYCMDVFKCENIAGVSVLREDPMVICGTPNHFILVMLASFGLIFYVLGYPAYTSWKLYDLNYHHAFSDEVNLRRFGFIYEKFELDYVFTPALIIIRKLLFVSILVYVNNPAFQVGALAAIIIASLMIHVYTAPYVDTYLDVLFSFLLLALMFEAFGGLMFYSDNLPDSNRMILEWIVMGTLFLLIAVFMAIFVMEVVRKYHIRCIKRAHVAYARNGQRCLKRLFSWSRAYSREGPESSWEDTDVSFELLDTFKPSYIYRCIQERPEIIQDWDKLTNILKNYVSDQSETSYLSMDPIAKFWRKLVIHFPEVVDFLAMADEETMQKFNVVATNLYRNFYLSKKVAPLPLMEILNWRDYAPIAQWLAVAPIEDRSFFLDFTAKIFRINGNVEAADMLESKKLNGGLDPRLDCRASRGFSDHRRQRYLDSFQAGSHPFHHSALRQLNTAAVVTLGIARFKAGPSKKIKHHALHAVSEHQKQELPLKASSFQPRSHQRDKNRMLETA